MEYSLTWIIRQVQRSHLLVLILILMEYSLTSKVNMPKLERICLNPYSNGILPDTAYYDGRLLQFVLILILMEYSLTSSTAIIVPTAKRSLNPYSNGILPDPRNLWY